MEYENPPSLLVVVLGQVAWVDDLPGDEAQAREQVQDKLGPGWLNID